MREVISNTQTVDPINISVNAKIAAIKQKHDEHQSRFFHMIGLHMIDEMKHEQKIALAKKQCSLLNLYVKAHANKGVITEQDKKDLILDYENEHETIRQSFIAAHKVFMANRQYYFNEELETLVVLSPDYREKKMAEFIRHLDTEISQHKEAYLQSLLAIATIVDLKHYIEQLDQSMHKLQEGLSKIHFQKQPYIKKQKESEETFIQQKREIYSNALLRAVKEDKQSVCEHLLPEKADILCQDKEGFSVLHLAVSKSMVEWLLTQGANTELTLNYKTPYDHRGFTPLHWHTLKGNISIIRSLLKANARVDACSQERVTPLFLATKIAPNPQLVELLMSYGANVRRKNTKGHYVMGSPYNHTHDKFADMAWFTDDLIALQASKGIQAWHIVHKQQVQIEEMQKIQKQFQTQLEKVLTENDALKKQIVLLQEKIQSTEEQHASSKTHPSSPRFF